MRGVALVLPESEADPRSWVSPEQWFKLHLHPLAMQPPSHETNTRKWTLRGVVEGPSAFELPPLPSKIGVEQVYADFIKYLTLVNLERS